MILLFRYVSRLFKTLEYKALVLKIGECNGKHRFIVTYGTKDDFPRCAICQKMSPSKKRARQELPRGINNANAK